MTSYLTFDVGFPYFSGLVMLTVTLHLLFLSVSERKCVGFCAF